MKTKTTTPRVGSIYNPKTGAVYQTRDTINALRLVRMMRAMEEYKLKNASSTTPAVQRKVKAISEVI